MQCGDMCGNGQYRSEKGRELKRNIVCDEIMICMGIVYNRPGKLFFPPIRHDPSHMVGDA